MRRVAFVFIPLLARLVIPSSGRADGKWPDAWAFDTTLVRGVPTQRVTVEQIPQFGYLSGQFRICEDGQCRRDSLLERVDEVEVVDIDTTDTRREVAVWTSGPSEDYEYAFYAWDRGRLVSLGHLGAVNEPLSGDGSLTMSVHEGFWFRMETWRYRRDRLGFVRDHVPDEIPIDVTQMEGSPIRTSARVRLRAAPGSRALSGVLPIRTRVSVEACRFVPAYEACVEGNAKEPCTWYRIRAVDGRVGWIPDSELSGIEGLPWAD